MTELRLPRMLSDSAGVQRIHQVEGTTVQEAIAELFRAAPALRNHIVDEQGRIRPHVLVFVDGKQASLGTAVPTESTIRVLHAVSGGSS